MLKQPILRTSLHHALHTLSRPSATSIRIHATPSRPYSPTYLRARFRPTGIRHFRNDSSDQIPSNMNITGSADKSSSRPSPQASDKPTHPTPIDTDEFHVQSDRLFERVLEQLEEIQEERGDLDVEYSQGVMTIIFPPIGTYVLNKQPPNKQIWLSSPMSGPKRFDWVVMGGSMDQKEGAEVDEWIYLRDGSSLADILRKELGVKMADSYER